MVSSVEVAKRSFQEPLSRDVLVLIGKAHQDGQKTVISEDEATLLVMSRRDSDGRSRQLHAAASASPLKCK